MSASEYTTTIVLGDTYRDLVSRWEGVATGCHFYMNGCVRVTLDGHDSDGKPKGFIFDEPQLEWLERGEVAKAMQASVPTGGPRDSTDWASAGRIPPRR